MSNYVLGLTGRKRSGKDTFAARLIERGFTRVSLADPLRAVCYTINPFVIIKRGEADLYTVGMHRLSDVVDELGWETAKEITEVRRLLQVTGTDAVRDIIGSETWTGVAARAISEVQGPVVITDVRFPNEAACADEVLRIVRPGLPPVDGHASETAMDGHRVRYEVINDSDIGKLHAAADLLIGTLLIREVLSPFEVRTIQS